MNNTQIKNSATIKSQIEVLNTQTVESLEKWNKMSKKQLIEVASKIKGLNFSASDKKEEMINVLTFHSFTKKINKLMNELVQVEAEEEKIKAQEEAERKARLLEMSLNEGKKIAFPRETKVKTPRTTTLKVMPEGYSMGEFNETKKQYPLLLNGVQVGKRGWWVGNEEQAIYWANKHANGFR